MFDAHKRKGSKRIERPGRFLSFSLLPSCYLLLCTDRASLSLSGKKMRLEEVAAWHSVKKKNKQAYSSWRRRTVTNENMFTLSSEKIHSYVCNLGKMGH